MLKSIFVHTITLKMDSLRRKHSNRAIVYHFFFSKQIVPVLIVTRHLVQDTQIDLVAHLFWCSIRLPEPNAQQSPKNYIHFLFLLLLQKYDFEFIKLHPENANCCASLILYVE